VSKGYGFINCENKKTYDRILEAKVHMIRNRQVEINQAIKRNVEVPEDIKLKVFKKLFIGGLALETAREDLIEHFSGFGKVANAYVIYDPISKQSKSKENSLISRLRLR
jgi:RNA recognition motif-containing protein